MRANPSRSKRKQFKKLREKMEELSDALEVKVTENSEFEPAKTEVEKGLNDMNQVGAEMRKTFAKITFHKKALNEGKLKDALTDLYHLAVCEQNAHNEPGCVSRVAYMKDGSSQNEMSVRTSIYRIVFKYRRKMKIWRRCTRSSSRRRRPTRRPWTCIWKVSQY